MPAPLVVNIGSKIFSMSSGAIPVPVSCTARIACESFTSEETRKMRLRSTTGRMASTAFAIRLSKNLLQLMRVHPQERNAFIERLLDLDPAAGKFVPLQCQSFVDGMIGVARERSGRFALEQCPHATDCRGYPRAVLADQTEGVAYLFRVERCLIQKDDRGFRIQRYRAERLRYFMNDRGQNDLKIQKFVCPFAFEKHV